jgi:NADPH:quinone reductase-like Zn-dependent oxidoreductase
MKAFSDDGLIATGSLLFDPGLSRLTTGRTDSLFAEDIKTHDADLKSAFAGRRILVTGGAGSIGSATLELLLQ